MINLMHVEIAKVQGLVQAIVAVAALAMVLYVWVKTKAVVPTVGAILFGAVVTWAVHHADFLQQKVDEEFRTPAAAVALAAAAHMPDPAGA